MSQMLDRQMVLKMPQQAYDTLFETLHMDTQSHHIDLSLRSEIDQALAQVTMIDSQTGDLPILSEGQKRWIVRATEREGERERLIRFVVHAEGEWAALTRAFEKLLHEWPDSDPRDEHDGKPDEFWFGGGQVHISKVTVEKATIERILKEFTFGGLYG